MLDCGQKVKLSISKNFTGTLQHFSKENICLFS